MADVVLLPGAKITAESMLASLASERGIKNVLVAIEWDDGKRSTGWNSMSSGEMLMLREQLTWRMRQWLFGEDGKGED